MRASFAAPGKAQILLSNEGDIAPYGWTRDGKSIVYWRADEWSASIWADGVDSLFDSGIRRTRAEIGSLGAAP